MTNKTISRRTIIKRLIVASLVGVILTICFLGFFASLGGAIRNPASNWWGPIAILLICIFFIYIYFTSDLDAYSYSSLEITDSYLIPIKSECFGYRGKPSTFKYDDIVSVNLEIEFNEKQIYAYQFTFQLKNGTRGLINSLDLIQQGYSKNETKNIFENLKQIISSKMPLAKFQTIERR